MNNGINNNSTYIGNFRVQQQSDNSTSQMMNQMADGFKPFYKKYDATVPMINQLHNLTNAFFQLCSNQQLGNNNYVSPV